MSEGRIQSVKRCKELNARLSIILTGKGIEASADETTTQLIEKVDLLPSINEVDIVINEAIGGSY